MDFKLALTEPGLSYSLMKPEMYINIIFHFLSRKGTRYLVVDCGGGTVDITVHEILPYGRLKELHRASGGPYGSTGKISFYLFSLARLKVI